MRSPFPGMDPYLEPHWLDVHASLATGSRDALNEQFPDDLVAHVAERVAIETQAGEEVEPMTERFVRVIEAATERLITVIELVSPTDKRGDGLSVFKSRRSELLTSGVNLVEVDLNRAGDWRRLLRPYHFPPRATTPYRVTVRIPESVHLHLYPIRLQAPLPVIPIPLRHHDPQARLELQALIDRAYSSGRYHRRLDYSKACEPPLDPEDSAWAEALLRQAGKR